MAEFYRKGQYSPEMRKRLIAPIAGGVAVVVVVVSTIAVHVHNNNVHDSHWKAARAAFAKADYDTTAKELKRLSVPSNASDLRIYGQTMLATNQLDKSLAAYKKLFAINKDPSVELTIGNVYNQQKNYDQAIKTYQAVISANPENSQAYVDLATLYRLRSDPINAVNVANQGVKNNPQSETLHELQVSMLMDQSDKQAYANAVSSLKQVAPNSPLLASLSPTTTTTTAKAKPKK